MKKLSRLLIATFFLSSTTAFSQSVGIGTDTPNAKAILHVSTGFDVTKGFIVSGDYNENLSSVPSLGPGARMMFFPGKSAFRAGAVIGSQWNNSNVGQYSAAFGYNSIASGGSSFAVGDYAFAIGFNSIALGSGTFASGNYSTSIGFGTNATGFVSTAFGYATHAKGLASSVHGEGSVARGYASTVVGAYNDSLITTPPQTVATDATPLFIVGNGTGNNQRSNAMVVQKNGAVMIGNSIPNNDAQLHVHTGTSLTRGFLVTGTYNANGEVPDLNAGTRMMFFPGKAAFRVGNVNGAQWNDVNVGPYSVATGQHTIATGAASTAMGYNTIASGTYSTTFGNNTQASGTYSAALGNSTSATNTYAVSMGNGTLASGIASTAMGNSSRARSNYSTTTGLSTVSGFYASTVLGMYNDSILTGSPETSVTDESALFIVGNGNSHNDRSNAMVVYKSGETEVSKLKVGGGTSITKLQAGEINAGSNPATGFKTFTYTFPTAFSTTPRLTATAKNDPLFSNVNDTFVITIRSITSTQVTFNIQRVDSNTGWSQQVRIEWSAWE